MDFANERYVRLYTRDTLTWELLGWEGQAVLSLSMRKLDRAGCLDIGDTDPFDAVAAVTRIPVETVRVGLARILERGVYQLGDGVIVMPKFVDAQEAAQSDKQRAKESRAKRRDLAIASKRDAMKSQTEAPRHETNENVTLGHNESQRVTPCRAVPYRAEDSVPTEPRVGTPSKEQRPESPTPRDIAWKFGVPLLMAVGVSEQSARSHLGRLSSVYGDPILSEAVVAAAKERPVDPSAWLEAACKRRKGDGNGTGKSRGREPATIGAAAGDHGGWTDEPGA